MKAHFVSEFPNKGIEIVGFKGDIGFISTAELEYYENPRENLPKILYIKRLYTLRKYRENEYAIKILQEISTRIVEGNLIGLLKNGIKEPNGHISFYKKRNWRYLLKDSETWMYFLNREINTEEKKSLKHLIKSSFPPEDLD